MDDRAALTSIVLVLGRHPPGDASPADGLRLGFEEVREEFVRHFAERDEVGAACAAYLDDRLVVDLRSGREKSPICGIHLVPHACYYSGAI